jgi:uncharacterized membrane protein
MATHPAAFAGVIVASLVAAKRLWLASFIGVLGHADTWLPRWLYAVHPLVLLGAGVADGGGASPLRGGRRVLALAIAAATGLATLAIAYAGWNAVGSVQIQGVQGRYFTPLVPLALAAFHAPRARGLGGAARLAFVAFAALALTVGVARVAARYYGGP